jgi:hypothetical protein
MKPEAGSPPCNRLSQPPPWHSSQGHPGCSAAAKASCAKAMQDSNMVYSRVERVFILEHCFVSKSFAAVREAIDHAYPDKEVPNKTTIHWLVTKFRDTRSVYLWQVLIERQNSWNYGRTDFKQCISCNNGIRLQEYNVAISLVVLSVNGFMCSCQGCVLNGKQCIFLSYEI